MSLGAGESDAPSSQRSLNAQETCGIASKSRLYYDANAAHLASSFLYTFVGAGCEFVGPLPVQSLSDFATPFAESC